VRDGARVRLFTRNGHDWTSRYPLIVEAALRNRQTSFVIDGEAVLLGVDGLSDFNGLHSRRHDDEVQLYAFDLLALDGEDLRKLPLHLRKTNLAMHMRLSYQNKAHWQMARQALNNAGASDDSEIRAWRTFRAAAAAEGWLVE
jgi:ATP-dependent DNA ligase